YLWNEIKINIEALKVSIMKDLNENEFIKEQTEGTSDDELDNAKAVAGGLTGYLGDYLGLFGDSFT
ncbi:35590_t:CDS:2, partial [Gigaspora margarita]